MNLSFPNIIEDKWMKKIFNSYTLYLVMGILVFGNILLFPNLLNHKDIKLNDMSYLIKKEVEIVPTPIEQVNAIVSNDEEKAEEIKEQSQDNSFINLVDTNEGKIIEEKAEDKKTESNSESESTETSSTEENVSINSQENYQLDNLEQESSKIKESEKVQVLPFDNIVEETKLEENTNSNNNNSVIIEENKNGDNTDNINSILTNESNTEFDNAIIAVVNTDNTVEDNKINSNETFSDESIAKPQEMTESTDHQETQKIEESQPFLAVIPEIKENMEEQKAEIIPSNPTEENPNNIQNEIRKETHSYYLIILYVILTSFIAGLVMFINKNYETFRQIYESGKATYKIRNYLYNGYELLED